MSSQHARTQLHTRTRTQSQTHTRILAFARTRARGHTGTYTHTHTHVQCCPHTTPSCLTPPLQRLTPTHTRAHARAHMHTCTPVHMHPDTHARAITDRCASCVATTGPPTWVHTAISEHAGVYHATCAPVQYPCTYAPRTYLYFPAASLVPSTAAASPLVSPTRD